MCGSCENIAFLNSNAKQQKFQLEHGSPSNSAVTYNYSGKNKELNLSVSSTASSSSECNLSVSSAAYETSTCSLKRPLFCSSGDESCLSQSISTSSLNMENNSAQKKQKIATEIEDLLAKNVSSGTIKNNCNLNLTPRKNEQIYLQPQIPEIKETRKKMKKLSSKEKLKLRIIFNELWDN